MPKKKLPKPTDGELEILRVLWRHGPSTVREVHDELNETKRTGYTTVLKLMQIMAEKGLARRDESQRSHVYHAQLSEEQTQRRIVRDVLDRAFGGSTGQLVLRALSARKTSPAELAEIRQLLDDLEERGQ